MKRFLFAAMLSLLAANLYAAADWKGKVLDENGEPLQYANVALLSSADSSVLGGVTTEADGSFNITSSGDGILMVAMMGYETQYLKPTDGVTVTLKPDNTALEGAVATAVMAKTKLTGEGLQTSVRGSVLENVGTAADVLGKTPGIIKGQNGIEVIGKGAPLIYINGHKVSDMTELDRLQSNEIQSVEVITNPGAQYSASVRSVVKIRTVKRNGEGFGFDITMKDEQSLQLKDHNDPTLNSNFNYRLNNLDFFAGFNFLGGSERQDSDLYSEMHGIHSFTNTGTMFVDYKYKFIQPNLGLNWQIADNHSVGFKVDFSRNYDMSQHQELYDVMTDDGKPYDETHTIGNYFIGDDKPQSLNSNIYYNGMVGKLGIDLNFDTYIKNDTEFSEIEEEDIPEKSITNINTETGADSRLYATKLVLSHPVWQGQLQFGTEETFSRMNNNYRITGTDIPASSSKVREDNIAAFATYGFVFKGMAQISAGLRYEHVNYAYDDRMGDGSFTKRYDNLFPNISFAGAFGGIQIMASYNEMTQRPGFGNLDNSIRYNSKYILQSGNATLQSQTLRCAELLANWKWLTASVDYTSAEKAIISWGYPYNDDGVIIVKPCNLEKPMRVLTAYVNAAPTIGIWTMNYTAAIINQWLTIDLSESGISEDTRPISFSGRPIFVGQIYNTFNFKHGWQFEFGGEFHSKGYTENVFINNTYLDLQMAIQKSFLKDKSLIVRLEGSDLTRTSDYDIHARFGQYLANQTNLMDNQRIALSIRYRFNVARSKYKGTGAGQDAISRMK